ncbi:thioester-forming surface-anchored protein [Corynebacterium diphtheriae]|nr:thioester-forming surface-anchored protein [Corynebacterium diphtheriae]
MGDKAKVQISDRVEYVDFDPGKYMAIAEVKSDAGVTDKAQTVAYGLNQFEIKEGEWGAGAVDVQMKPFEVTADGKYTVFERVYKLTDQQAEKLKSLYLFDGGYKFSPSDAAHYYIKNGLEITDDPVTTNEKTEHNAQTVSITVKPKDVVPPADSENSEMPGAPSVKEGFKSWWIYLLIGLGALGVLGSMIIAQGPGAILSKLTNSSARPV